MKPRWTRFDDLVSTLRRRWNTGQYLRAYASGEPWSVITLPVRAPTATELLQEFDDAVRWVDQFRKDSHTAGGRPRVTVDYATRQNRLLGANEVPVRIHLDSLAQLAALLGTTDEISALDDALDETTRTVPPLRSWVVEHPRVTIDHYPIWSELLATVRWIIDHDTTLVYLRQLDVARVDTKFVERNRKILGQLLTSVLPADRVSADRPDFASRYGFRSKPIYTRFRILTPLDSVPSHITELRLRADELALSPLAVATVFVVENEVSYLAFPDVADAIVIFGEGFQVTTLEALPWLRQKQIVYWGDIDTHGFAILNQLRGRFPTVTSILMDHATLLAHPDQYVTEPAPTAEPQPHLTEQEQSLYRDLIEDRFGRSVRLEQERVRFSLLHRALQPWMHDSPNLNS